MEQRAVWDRFRVTRESAEPVAGTGGREFWLAGHRCWPLPENGWGAVLAWVAGHTRVWRAPEHRERHTTLVTQHATAVRPARRHQRPRTAAEQDIVDDDIDSYLANAGLPPRPRGYAWYLLLPEGTLAARLLKAINTEENKLGKRSIDATDTYAVMETVTRRVWGH